MIPRILKTASVSAVETGVAAGELVLVDIGVMFVAPVVSGR